MRRTGSRRPLQPDSAERLRARQAQGSPAAAASSRARRRPSLPFPAPPVRDSARGAAEARPDSRARRARPRQHDRLPRPLAHRPRGRTGPRAQPGERGGALRSGRRALREAPGGRATAPPAGKQSRGSARGGRAGGTHLVAPLEDVLVTVAQRAVDVEELEDAVLPHVLRVPPRLLPAQRRALRQQPHAGPG